MPYRGLQRIWRRGPLERGKGAGGGELSRSGAFGREGDGADR